MSSHPENKDWIKKILRSQPKEEKEKTKNRTCIMVVAAASKWLICHSRRDCIGGGLKKKFKAHDRTMLLVVIVFFFRVGMWMCYAVYFSEEEKTKCVSTYHEHEQQQHQHRQHGLCDCGRFNGPPILFVVLCVAPPPTAPPLPCDDPRSRQLALVRSCNSDTLHDILFEIITRQATVHCKSMLILFSFLFCFLCVCVCLSWILLISSVYEPHSHAEPFISYVNFPTTHTHNTKDKTNPNYDFGNWQEIFLFEYAPTLLSPRKLYRQHDLIYDCPLNKSNASHS